MEASLGNAIAENFKQAPLNSNALIQGIQLGEQSAQRQAAKELLAQKRKEDQDAKAQKELFNAVNVSGIDRWDEKQKNDIIANGTKSYWDNRNVNPMAASQSLMEMHNRLSNLAALKENREKFRNNPNKTEYGKTLEADIEKSGSLQPHLGKINIFGDEGVTNEGKLLSPDSPNVDYDKIINSEVDRGKEQSGQIQKNGGFLYEEKGYPRTNAEARKYESSIKSATGFDTKLNSLENVAAATWQDPKIRRSFSRANEDLYKNVFDKTEGNDNQKRASADLAMANKWAEYVDSKYIGRISAQNLAKPTVPKEGAITQSTSSISNDDTNFGLYVTNILKSKPSGLKTPDGQPISWDQAIQNPKLPIVSGANKEGQQKITTAGAMVDAAKNGLMKTYKDAGASVTTITNPKGKPFVMDSKTFDGNNMSFIKLGGKTYFVGNAATLAPSELAKLSAGDTPMAKLKELGLYDVDNSAYQTILRNQNKDARELIDKDISTNTTTTSIEKAHTGKKSR